MDLSFRTEDCKRADKEMIAMFCERHVSEFVRKSPEYIIEKWLEFFYSRYKVQEVNDGFFVTDFEEKEMIAYISKKDPRAFSHAFELCDKLNNPPEAPFVSCDGREIKFSPPAMANPSHGIVDFLINEMEKDEND